MKKPTIAIIVSRFNEAITANLLFCCLDELRRHGLTGKQTRVFWTPGAYELPFTAQHLAKSKRYDAVIALGCVIKGQTSHDVHVATWASVGLGLVSLQTDTPVLFGVLTPNSESQARARSKPGPLNRGKEVASAALEILRLKREMSR